MQQSSALCLPFYADVCLFMTKSITFLDEGTFPEPPPPSFSALQATCMSLRCVDAVPDRQRGEDNAFSLNVVDGFEIKETKTMANASGEYTVYVITVNSTFASWTVSYRDSELKELDERIAGIVHAATEAFESGSDGSCSGISGSAAPFGFIKASDLPSFPGSGGFLDGAKSNIRWLWDGTNEADPSVVASRCAELAQYLQELNGYLRHLPVAVAIPAALAAFREFVKEPLTSAAMLECMLKSAESLDVSPMANTPATLVSAAAAAAAAAAGGGGGDAGADDGADDDDDDCPPPLEEIDLATGSPVAQASAAHQVQVPSAMYTVGQSIQMHSKMAWWDCTVVDVHESSVTVEYPKKHVGFGRHVQWPDATLDFEFVRPLPGSPEHDVFVAAAAADAAATAAAATAATAAAAESVATDGVSGAEGEGTAAATTPDAVNGDAEWYTSTYDNETLIVKLKHNNQHGITFVDGDARLASAAGTVAGSGTCISVDDQQFTTSEARLVDEAGRLLVNPAFLASDAHYATSNRIISVQAVVEGKPGHCVGVRPGMHLAAMNGVRAEALDFERMSVFRLPTGSASNECSGDSGWVTMEFVTLPDVAYTSIVSASPSFDFGDHQDAVDSMLLLTLKAILKPSDVPSQGIMHQIVTTAAAAAAADTCNDDDGIDQQALFERAASSLWLHFNEFLKLGANINCSDEDNQSPLYIVASHENLAKIAASLSKRDTTATTPTATTNYLLKWLLQCEGVDVEQCNSNNDLTALQVACKHGYVSTVVELIEQAGADSNVGAGKLPPLLLALEGASKETAASIKAQPYCNFMATAEYLLDKAANANSVDDAGVTPLLLVCRHAPDNFNLSTIWWLVNHGADPTLADAEGCFPLLAICERVPSLFGDFVGAASAYLFGTSDGFKQRSDMLRACLGMGTSGASVEDLTAEQAAARQLGIDRFVSTINRSDHNGRSVLLAICESLSDWDLAVLINQHFDADPTIKRTLDNVSAYSVAKAARKADVLKLFAAYSGLRVEYAFSAPVFVADKIISPMTAKVYNNETEQQVEVADTAAHRFHFESDKQLPAGLALDRKNGTILGKPALPTAGTTVLTVVNITLLRVPAAAASSESRGGAHAKKVVGRCTLSLRVSIMDVAAEENNALSNQVANLNRIGSTSLHVNASDLIKSSVDGLMAMARANPSLKNASGSRGDRGSLPYIIYHDTVDGQQHGMDWGGIFRDWLFKMAAELFDPTYGLFDNGDCGLGAAPFLVPATVPRDHALHGPLSKEEQHKLYWLAGHLIALSICTDTPLGVRIAPYLLKHVAGRKASITFADYQQLDFTRHKFISECSDPSLRPEEVDEKCEDYMLSFAVNSREIKSYKALQEVGLGAGVTYPQREASDLVVGGAEKQVTHANLNEYLNLVTSHELVKGVARDAGDSMRSGLTSRANNNVRNTVRSKSAEQLSSILCGPTTLDVEALRAATTVENQHRLGVEEAASVKHFWQYMRNCSNEERILVLRFWTGYGALPRSTSWGAYPPRITMTSGNRDKALPVTHTCFCQIILPVYSTLAICTAKCRFAVQNGMGFAIA